MEMATQYFEAALQPQYRGAGARLSARARPQPAAQTRFRIGYAPDSPTA
jgi:DNA primase